MENAVQARRLIAAEVELAWLARRLAETQVAALLGIHYDDQEYDQVILEHRRARSAAAAERRTWQHLPAAPPIAA
jgi:hypothetical protein